jgi:hypothetical protein
MCERMSVSEQKESPLDQKTVGIQVLETLGRTRGCTFEQLVKDCAAFTWNQLFVEVVRLQQLEQLRLISIDGRYHLTLWLTLLPLPISAQMVLTADSTSRSMLPIHTSALSSVSEAEAV